MYSNDSRDMGRMTRASLVLRICSYTSVVRLLLSITMVLFGQSSYAQELNIGQEDGVHTDIKIFFRYDDDRIDANYMGNQKMFHIIDSLLHNEQLIAHTDTISVVALSSPEGAYSYNARLSERRKQTLERYLTAKYTHIPSDLWYFSSMPENWIEFRELLESASSLPYRDEVLTIVDNPALDPDGKERQLRALRKGASWSYIKEHILPKQRYGSSIVFIPHKEPEPEPEPFIHPDPDPLTVTLPYEYNLVIAEPTVVEPEVEQWRAIIAIKSNLVLDLLTAVNLAVEVPIGERFSVVGEVVYPWWRSWPTNYTMQIESYHGEVKYWLGDRTDRDQLTGWSVGLYGGWGRYDIQPFSETGVQGDFYDVGAEVGYSMPLVKNLNLEFSLGLGYVSTNYYDYYMAYDTEEFGDIKVIPYPWAQSKLKSVLPTRLGVSLVWVIGKSKRGGEL